MFETLSRCGWAPELSASSITTTPLHFAQRFPASRGSLYGPASHGMLSPLARTGASSKIPGLYFAGGGAHPGAGVPMAATSGVPGRSRHPAQPRFDVPVAIDGYRWWYLDIVGDDGESALVVIAMLGNVFFSLLRETTQGGANRPARLQHDERRVLRQGGWGMGVDRTGTGRTETNWQIIEDRQQRTAGRAQWLADGEGS